MTNVTIDGLNEIQDGRTVVATAGTAVQISTTSTPCRRITIQAETNNTGNIAVGASTVVAAVATARGVILAAGDAVDVYINNLDKVYIDSTVNGDGVTYTYYKG